ncbi:MAG: 16S rRNA (adenine(1518)-N(6)/adenine(1519)-N(6))-dimethyltransferase RsmA [Actinomycetota bacterium]|nr:16S rRNA (adenine(1518)-N(6)/adenine(1519)-N(6))-dimethyltransferase RsmA [Actinomycetota bacterium]
MHSRSDIGALLSEHGLAPRRDLGQNFVVDANTVRKVARLAEVGPNDHVVEIGAGLGSLTLALAETGATITAIEIDRGVAGALRSVVAGLPNVTVVEDDALRLDWKATLAAARRWVLVANLPYNVATPLVCDLLDFVPSVERMLVMVQREVAERLCARAGTEAYGAVTVKVAYWATARIAGTEPASVFVPRPKVESALADIRRRRVPAVDVPADPLFQLVRTAFGQRRKMLRRSLGAVVGPDVFDAAGIDAQRRPEELDIAEWGALTSAWLVAT